jgi:hypothetical protein
MRNYKRILPILLYSIFGIYICYLGHNIWINKTNIEKLNKNHIVLCATISSAKYKGEGRGGRNIINYSFIYNTKKIEIENNVCTLSTVSNYENGVNKILVVVSKSDPYVNALLENPSDYYKFNISQRDTTGVLCSQF